MFRLDVFSATGDLKWSYNSAGVKVRPRSEWDRLNGIVYEAALEQRIDAADVLTCALAPRSCVTEGDHITLYHAPKHTRLEDHPGFKVGTFRVHTVEGAISQNGDHELKVTAQSCASWMLMETPIPTKKYMDEVDFNTGLTRLSAIINTCVGSLTILQNNPPPAPLNEKIKDDTSDNALAALTRLMQASDSHWRSRPDLGCNVIEVGQFGTIQPIYLRQRDGVADSGLAEEMGVYWFADATYMSTDQDRISCVIATGASYSLGTSEESIDLTMCGASAPAGYTLTTHTVNGQTFCELCKNVDEFGQPFPCKRSRLQTFSGVTPLRNDTTASVNTGDINTAKQQLVNVAAQWLAKVSQRKIIFSPEVPYALTNAAYPGDRLHIEWCDTACGETLVRDVYIATRNTAWTRDGKETTKFELSTIMESLADPLSRQWSPGSAPQSAPTPVSAQPYTLCIDVSAVTGLGGYTFPTPYPVAPFVAPRIQPIGCTWSIKSVTATEISVAVTPVGCTASVCVLVTPQ